MLRGKLLQLISNEQAWFAAIDKSAPTFTAIRHNSPPCWSRFMKVSIEGMTTACSSPVVVVVVADCACRLSTVYFWMS
jgi:hypothetical protein